MGINLNVKFIESKMNYAPWKLDDQLNYLSPTKEEIKKTYSISGVAIVETLLFFEESGGDLKKLIERLNTVVINDNFFIDKETLSDKSRWYSNEYYFYLQMICKGIIGDFNWRYGMGKGEQLSVYHKIYEKGLTDFAPWGLDENGKEVNDVTMNNINPILLYIENILKNDTSRCIEFINSIIPEKYRVDRAFYMNETTWVSVEIIEYFYEIFRIITNNSLILIDALNYSILHFIRIPKLMLTLPKKLYLSGLNKMSDKTNNCWSYDFKLKNGYMIQNCKVKPNFNKNQFSNYNLSCFDNMYNINVGAFTAIIQLLFNLDKAPEYKVVTTNKPEDYDYGIEFKWSVVKTNILTSVLFGVFISSILTFILSLLKSNNFVFMGLSLTLFLISVTTIIRQYLENKTLKMKMINREKAAREQLEELEKTASELVKEKQSLEVKVHDRTKDLKEANDKLLELDRTKTNFLTNVTHEFKTPLTLIMNPLRDIIKGNYGDNISRKEKILKIAKTNADKLYFLIGNFLNFNLIEQNKFNIRKHYLDIIKILKSAVVQFESLAMSKGLKINFNNKTDKDKVVLYSDFNLFESLIQNLLSNAVKFTYEGNIEVFIDIIEGSIEICVVDSGIGIPEERIGAIFEKFYQVENSRNRRNEGSGIGLALVKDIVELHDGKIECISEIDKGSIFRIIFPYIIEYQDITESIDIERILKDENFEENRITKKSKIAKTILIVEDNVDMQEYISEILCEYNIISAMNGNEALNILNGNKIDLIISDIMMPEMDGIEFFGRFIKNKQYSKIPFIFLSALDNKNDKLNLLKQGSIDYITKPFLSEELIYKVDSITNIFSKNDNGVFIDCKAGIGDLINQYKLTSREAEVAEFILQGLLDKEISDKLFLSKRTVETHIYNLYKKLGISNRIELFLMTNKRYSE